MKFAFSVFVALAIAVAAPTHAAVVTSPASGTAVSAAAGQSIAPQLERASNSTAQSAPVSHATNNAVSCFGSGSRYAPVANMRYLAYKFCDKYAPTTLQAGHPGPSIVDWYWLEGAGDSIPMSVQLAIGPGENGCTTVVGSESCKAEMNMIIDACGGHGGSVYYPERCLYFAEYPCKNC